MQEDAVSKGHRTNCWVLFPLVGLTILDAHHDLDSPLFGDATVIARKHLPSIVSIVASSKSKKDLEWRRKTVSSMERDLGHELLGWSLLAVRRTGPFGSPLEEAHRLAQEKMIESASRRAFRLAAAISLSLISTSKDWHTCGLLSRSKDSRHNVAMVYTDRRVLAQSMSSGGHSLMWKMPAYRMTRSGLRTRLGTRPVSALANILLPQQSPIPVSLANAVGESSVQLAEALYTDSEASRLLGAVTAIEMLLTDQGTSYDITKKRLLTLLGKFSYAHFEADRVFEKRHLYVHRGIAPAPPIVPLQATGLALACQIVFAHLATRFPSKDRLLTYLDFVSAGNRMCSDWSPNDRAHFRSLLRHGHFKTVFPFFRNVDPWFLQ